MKAAQQVAALLVTMCCVISGMRCASAFVSTTSLAPKERRSEVISRISTSPHSRVRFMSRTIDEDTDDDGLTPKPLAIAKASLLIAGTTVGGGFLALPQTVVVPLDGFPVTAASLSVVWIFLLAQSWILCRSIVTCYQETGRDGLGITYLAQHVLNAGGPSLFLLVILTEATLVSQLARAGILYAAGDSSMAKYQIGCTLAAAIGGIVSLGNNKIATNSNSFLTVVFLVSAALLFQAGHAQADWTKCLVSASTVSASTVARAIPTMLQLLVYGEILPNVCRMLNYRLRDIRAALVVGSFIPLLLLSGWAALGVALLPTLSSSIDPVSILLQNSGAVIQNRLTILAIAAIGTTILGSFLALQSAYNDVVAMEAREDKSNWLQNPIVSALVLVVPPLAISLISPSLFFKAIDFAGAYPVLLLFGVLPPLVWTRMNEKDGASGKRLSWSSALGLLSIGMIGLNVFKDGVGVVTRLLWSLLPS